MQIDAFGQELVASGGSQPLRVERHHPANEMLLCCRMVREQPASHIGRRFAWQGRAPAALGSAWNGARRFDGRLFQLKGRFFANFATIDSAR